MAGVNATLQGNLATTVRNVMMLSVSASAYRGSDLVLAWPRLIGASIPPRCPAAQYVHGGGGSPCLNAARGRSSRPRRSGVGALDQSQLEQVELDFGCVEREALVLGFVSIALQHVTWIAGEGSPSEVRMSQNMRAVPCGPRHGRIWNVEIGLNDHIVFGHAGHALDEPSKPRPSSNAASSSAGAIATDFSV